MKWKTTVQLLLPVLALGLMVAACGGADDGSGDVAGGASGGETGSGDVAGGSSGAETGSGDGSAGSEGLTPVTLRLQWFPQAQFAGYYAARELGFYQDAGLEVAILDHSAGVSSDTASGLGATDPSAAEFEVLWVPRGLARRAGGDDIVNIAQVFQRNGMLQVSFADSGIASVGDLEGRTVGHWGSGNEAELLAGLRQNGLDPDTDVELVLQGSDMSALLDGRVDSAQAMVYNEYAQLLETVAPDTGELYQSEDFNVIDWNEEGTAMLQDALWADAARLGADTGYRETAVKFVEASLRGWAHCRDEPEECVQIVLEQAAPDSAASSDEWSLRGESHQEWQLNEVNALIWPAPLGVGVMDPGLWAQTVEVAIGGGVIDRSLDEPAYRTDIAEEALANLRDEGVDVIGDGWERVEVELREGGS